MSRNYSASYETVDVARTRPVGPSWGDYDRDFRASCEWNWRGLKSNVAGVAALVVSAGLHAFGSGEVANGLSAVLFAAAGLCLNRTYFCHAQVERIEARNIRRATERRERAVRDA